MALDQAGIGREDETIGYFFGEQWQVLFKSIERYIKIVLVGLAVAAAAAR